jgi:hypothetical protein
VSDVLKALVVGCGAIGSGYDADRREDQPPLSHAGAYAAHDDTDLVGGVDPDRRARERFELRWARPTYPCLADALRAVTPDIASICTPVDARVETITALVDAGVRGVWCEKPMAATLAEARKVVDAARDAGVAVQMNFLRRFDPAHQAVVSAVHEAGGPRHIDVRFSGAFENFGPHAYDLVRWLGGEPTWIQALPVSSGEPIVLLGTERWLATLTRVTHPSAVLFEVEVFTSGPRWLLLAAGERMFRAEPSRSSLYPWEMGLGDLGRTRETSLEAAMMGGVTSLAWHLTSGRELLCDGDDGIASLALAQAADDSLSGGGLRLTYVEVRA